AVLKQSLLGSEMCPDASKAVGLQFNAGRHLVGFSLAHPLTLAVELRQDADQVLDMMAHLVRDYIGLREIAGCPEFLRQFAEEAEIDIDLGIAGAVERSGSRRGEAAR